MTRRNLQGQREHAADAKRIKTRMRAGRQGGTNIGVEEKEERGRGEGQEEKEKEKKKKNRVGW